MNVLIDGVEYVPKTNTDVKQMLTAADVFAKYDGTKEYGGIVATIQTWYYGKVVRAAWCATSLSWVLAQLGIMKYTMSTKQENVFLFDQMLQKTKTAKTVKVEEAIRGDIVVLNFSGTFSPSSSKHITVYTGSKTADALSCIGGNQDDKICVKNYKKANVVRVWRPDYSKNTLDSLAKLPVK